MKKITTLLCGIIGVGCLSVAPIALTNTASAEGNVSENIVWNTSDLYVLENVVDEQPKTFEAWLQLDETVKSKGGTVFGNFGANEPFEEYPIESKDAISVEISTKGNPRLYYETPDGSVSSVVFASVDVRSADFVHLTITRDDTTAYCYVNGELKEKADFQSEEFVSIYNYAVGGDYRSDRSNYFKGQIKSIAVYSDYRTQDEIIADKTAVNVDDENLMVNYDLSGQNGADFIADKSKNGNDLTRTWLFADSIEQEDYDYSMIAVGDPQALNLSNGANYEKMYDYIAENVDDFKVKHVFGLGDITDESRAEEFERAKNGHQKLDAVGVSYSLICGNHDFRTDSAINHTKWECSSFASTFGGEDSAYVKQSAYVYDKETALTTAHTFSAGNLDYLVVTISWAPSDDELAWADELIAAHPYHNVIVTTHGYIYGQGGLFPTTSDRGQNRPEKIDEVVKKHKNVVMVLCGHVKSKKIESYQVTGDNGNVITQMLIDPTFFDKDKNFFPNGSGMIANLCFSENGSKVSVNWFSTVRNQYFKSESVYSFTIPTIARKQIKTEVNGNGGEIITNRMDIVGEPIQITTTPKQNHHLTKLTVGGVDVTADVVNGVYTLATDENTADGLLVFAEFAEDTKYAVTLQNENDKGIITTNTSATEHFVGTELTWKITAKSGWKVAGVTLNGNTIEKNSDGEYTGVVEGSQNVLSVQYEKVNAGSVEYITESSTGSKIGMALLFFAIGAIVPIIAGVVFVAMKKKN